MEELKKRLEEIPEKIKEIEIDLLDLKEKIDAKKRKKKLIESEVMRDIQTAKTEDGKRKYSNKTMRENELQKRLNNNPKYQRLKYKVDNKERVKRMKKINLNYQHNRLKSLRSIVRLGDE